MKKFRLSSRLAKGLTSPIRKQSCETREDMIDLSLGDIRFPTHPLLLDEARRLLDTTEMHYTPNAGIPALRSAIAGQYGLSADTVCVTNGAEEALFAVLLCCLEAGDQLLCFNPGYVAYSRIAQLCGASTVVATRPAAGGFRLSRKELERAWNPRVRVVILSNPSNPLGTALDTGEQAMLLEFCHEKDVYLVVDEVYRGLSIGGPVRSFAGDAGCFVVSSLSKSHGMTGWRLGWAVCPEGAVEAVTRAHQYISTCASTLSQHLAVFALSSRGAKVNRELMTRLDRNRLLVKSMLEPLGQPLDSDAHPYLFIRLHGDEEENSLRLTEAGVLAVPGSGFGTEARGWFRFAYACPEERLRIGCERIRIALGTD